MLSIKKIFQKSNKIFPLTKKPATFWWEIVFRWGAIAVLCALLSFSLATGISQPKHGLEIGDISSGDIKAPRTFPVVNRQATQKEEKKTIEQVPRVYTLNRALSEDTVQYLGKIIDAWQRIDMSVNMLKTELREFNEDNRAAPEKDKDVAEKIKRFRKEVNLHLNDADLKTFFAYASQENYQVMNKIEEVLGKGFKQIFRNGVLKNKQELIEAIKPKTTVYLKQGDKLEGKPYEVANLYSLPEALEVMQEKIKEAFPPEKERGLNLALTHLSELLILPNVTYDLLATKNMVEEARSKVLPIMMTIKQGQMIVREGEQVNEDQYYILKTLSTFQARTTIKVVFGRTLWVVFLLLLGLCYLAKFYPEIYQNNSSMLLLGLITFFLVPFTRGLMIMKISAYYLPLAVAPLIISIIFSPQLALLSALILAAMFYPIIAPQLHFIGYVLVGSIVGIINASQLRKRDDLIKAGLLIGLANVAVLLLIPLYTDQDFFSRLTVNNVIIGLANGLLTYFIAMGVLPALEILFNITTDIKLIELSDLNRPILRKMALEAPGTYHHSIIVGNLAEAAAEGIKANPLLVRVAAYYHDVGKIDKSEYFSENNRENSRHDNLSPNMSSLILISHVKEGVELARKNKLPNSIIDIIRQHHGNTMVSFFYQKALNEDEHETMKKDDFRYPGPKPQSKEAAILMLADSVEATSRSLPKITSTTIRNMIRKTIQNKLEDKQLDECELTLKDLRVITANFERVLSAIFHTRIEYPEEKSKEEKKGVKWA